MYDEAEVLYIHMFLIIKQFANKLLRYDTLILQ